MRCSLPFILLGLLSLVQAISISGSRLLVVIEEAAEKIKYSTLWKDLEGMSSYTPIVLLIEIAMLIYDISRQRL